MKKIIAVITVSSTILFLASTSYPISDTAKEHYDKGYKLIDEKKLDKAEAEMLEAIKIEPDFADAHQELGYIYSQKGVLDKATVECRKSVRLDPKDPVAWRTLGAVYYARSLFMLAVKAVEKAVEVAPDFADAHYDLAQAYYRLGEETAFNKEILDNTIMQIEKYQALVPAAANVKQNREFLEKLKKKRNEMGGITTMTIPESRGNIEKLKFSDKSLQRIKDQIAGKTNKDREIDERVSLMMDLLKRGEKDEALVESEEVLQLDPVNKGALSISAAVLYKNKIYDKCIAQAEKAAGYYPDLSILYDLLARAYYKKGDNAKSSEMISKLRDLDPEMADKLQKQIGDGNVN